jgi:hypothetical protein
LLELFSTSAVVTFDFVVSLLLMGG